MKLFLKYLRIHVRSIAEYKASFLLALTGQLTEAVFVLVSIKFLFMRFGSVSGFTMNEVLICYATVLMSFSLAETVFRGFDHFPAMIKSGEFDRVLTRPRNAIFQVLGMKINIARAGRLIQGLAVMIYILSSSAIPWDFGKIALLIFMVVAGFIYFAGLFIVYAAISIFTIEGLEFMNVLTDGGRSFGAYPASIYGQYYLKFFTYVIPFACFQYYPFLYILGRSDNILYAILPVFCFIFIIPCILFWKFSVHKYHSTGS